MKKWSWLLVLVMIFLTHGIWTIVQADKTASVSTRDIPHRDILENFGDVLGLWADEQDLMDIEKLDIDCQIDDLLVETETTVGNQQAYRTITLTLNMYLDTESNKDYLYIDYQEITRALQDTLRQSPYCKYLRKIDMNYYRADNSAFLFAESAAIGSTKPGGSTGIKQERKEHKTQTIAYNFADKLGYKEFDDGTETMHQYGFSQLTHFGMKHGTNELYVEIEMPSAHKEHLDAFRASLKVHADALYEEIAGNGTAVKYMDENNVETVSIVFCTPWDTECAYHSFEYQRD